MRVLYVEDNQDVRELTEFMLQDEGLEFVSCGNAAAAELAFEKEHFDVLITDISLPDLPGTVLATRLQQRSAHLWIVFCSGYSVAHGLSAWGRNTRALRKPFEADELHALVQEIRVDRAPPE